MKPATVNPTAGQLAIKDPLDPRDPSHPTPETPPEMPGEIFPTCLRHLSKNLMGKDERIENGGVISLSEKCKRSILNNNLDDSVGK